MILSRRVGAAWQLLCNGAWGALLRIVYARYVAVALGRLLTPLRRAHLRRIINNFDAAPIYIIKSTVDWGYPYWQRPQHLAKALSCSGVNCLFVSPRFGFDSFIVDSVVNDRLAICDDVMSAIRLADAPVVYLLSTDNTISKSYLDHIRSNRNVRLVYDYIDEIDEAVSRAIIPEGHIRAHQQILRDEDIYCIASARVLYDEVFSVRRKRFALVTNGVDVDHFRRSRDLSSLDGRFRVVCETGKPIVGYYGALASWVDYGLIERLARDRPQYEFVMIGPDYDGSSVHLARKKIPNLSFIPPVKYEQLPSLAVWFDVCCIPFLLNDITHSTSPLKLFEYMALGKPIVSTPIQEAEFYETVVVGESAESFMTAIDDALNLDSRSPYWEKLAEDAQRNSWQGKAKEILAAISHNDSAADRAAVHEQR